MMTGTMRRRALGAALMLALAAPAPAAALPLPFPGRQAEAAAPVAPPRPVVTEFVTDTAQQERTIPGVIVAATEVQMAFQTLGRIIERPVDVGDRVRQGDLLARLDPEDLASSTRAAEAAVAAAEVNLETARNTAERARALARRNVASTADLEQVRQALAAAVAADQQARADLVRARDTAAFAEMRAPFSGVISAVMAAPGTVVSAGEPVLQLSAQNRLEAVIDLAPPVMARLDLGGTFEVWSENHAESRQKATVSRVAPVADALTRTRRVHLALEDSSGFRLGALIRVRPAVTTPQGTGLPPSAILHVEGRPHVWLVTRQGDRGTVSLRPIQILGSATAQPVTVTAGLVPGDEVVIRGIHSLREGQAVGRSVSP